MSKKSAWFALGFDLSLRMNSGSQTAGQEGWFAQPISS